MAALTAWLLGLLGAGEAVRIRRGRRPVRSGSTSRRRSDRRARSACASPGELHDALGHHLSLINMQSGIALHLNEELTPVQAPNANAFAERWVGTVRAECLDWLLIVGRRHLEQVLRVYIKHYNQHRPHRALRLEPPAPPGRVRQAGHGDLIRGEVRVSACPEPA
jgi:transposase InsO family protein